MNLTALESTIAAFRPDRRRRNKVHPQSPEPTKNVSHRGSSLPTQTSSSLPAQTSTTTKSIPISKSMRRTPSELQLSEDEAMADYRDYCMFARIVNGISEHQACSHHPISASVIANIVRTRHLPIQESSSYPSYHNEEPTLQNHDITLQSACKLTESFPWPLHQSIGHLTIREPPEETSSEEGVFELDL
jgi:hypothetical protein